jgi:hypothetical protein
MTTPKPAMRITLAGLIPFIASAGFFIVSDIGLERAVASNNLEAANTAAASATLALQSLFFYSAAILSFLGGARWGMELRDKPDAPNGLTLILSVFPALVAWIALLIGFSPAIALAMLMGAFGAMLYWDMDGARTGETPVWYKIPRLYATLGAIACLGAAFFRIVLVG